MIVHLVQCVFFILPTWLMWYYKGDGEEVGEGGRHIPLRLVWSICFTLKKMTSKA